MEPEKQQITFDKIVKANLPKTKKEWFWFCLTILLVVTLGLFAFNQYIAISYKAHLIMNPCDLCETYEQNFNQGTFRIEDINLTNTNYSKYIITP